MDNKQARELFGDVLKTLKEELKLLTNKIEKARENDNYGTYKNLILAYKEVLNLYKQTIKDIEKHISKELEPQPINYHIHIENIKTGDTKNFIEQLKNLTKNTGM